ncbi:SPFH domain-containing protein [Streptomyces sp. NPDC002187]|uniref:slipin family protein n=1 Tax=Streptomyces sp. NPDC002187 TaxID=3364637 RepID=UPI00367B06BC
MVEELVVAGVAAASVCVVYVAAAAKVVKQYERGIVFRLGRLRNQIRQPGFTMIVPGVDRLRKVNMQIVTLPIPAQEGITRDNVTVRVDAVVYFRVIDPANAVIEVEDYRFAVSQMAQTSLRSIIGKSDLDDLLCNREKLNQGLELMIDSPAVGWGVQVDRVEIKDVSLPEAMKRSMARQAEADRERRARVINADAELQASVKLSEAAKEMSKQPAALQLRLLQTVVAVAAEKNSTLVLPFPVELLRFLERAQQPGPAGTLPPHTHTADQAAQGQTAPGPATPEPGTPELASAQPVDGRAAGVEPVPERSALGAPAQGWPDPDGGGQGPEVASGSVEALAEARVQERRDPSRLPPAGPPAAA